MLQHGEQLPFFAALVRRIQEPVHALGRSSLQVALELRPGGAEAGSAVQVGDLAQVPEVVGRGLVGRPRPLRRGHREITSTFRSKRTSGITSFSPGLTVKSLVGKALTAISSHRLVLVTMFGSMMR